MEYKDKDKIRIWLEDTVEPEGGTWCYGCIKDVTIQVFVQDGWPMDIENTVQSLNNYKIEKL